MTGIAIIQRALHQRLAITTPRRQYRPERTAPNINYRFPAGNPAP